MTKRGSVGLGIGAAIGYGASWAMDQATGWYLERQSKASRRREDEIEPGGTPVLAGRKLAGWVGRDVTDDEAGRVGFIVHRSLRVAYGMTAAGLAEGGGRPGGGGVTTGAVGVVLGEA